MINRQGIETLLPLSPVITLSRFIYDLKMLSQCADFNDIRDFIEAG
jgi:hypothetical protein